jgi:large subunit ribosomal protein L24e
MVFQRVCSFCGSEIEPGTGKMFIKKDGVVHYFCRSKCQKNMLNLKRLGRETQWTTTYLKETGKDQIAEEEEEEEEEEEGDEDDEGELEEEMDEVEEDEEESPEDEVDIEEEPKPKKVKKVKKKKEEE